ncbi:1-acyl-sn-glycerol-3-phosphate acyltransferase [Streptomyces sp. TS71-3]|uniref:lysophospholipid acyltransferase family protein n=1 Tax=Streptomyces sp. TS71-3 TaxID=2733862 RepID=UPI001B20E056|nr:lysophospholipid acyltransferase family protein [Streptomyces sp. TS71-3]GHJ42137.1 1-acyl-sn-glycerol-3-phosphate acyltransferase [Streptomyces sp. TS71-3]
MSLWQPTSTCTPEACITGKPLLAGVAGAPRAVIRIAALLAILIIGIALTPVVFRFERVRRERLVRFWCRALVRAIGVKVRITGGIAAESGVLVVANHISWLDIPLLAAVRPSRMLAKSDVRDWPVAGPLAARGSTLFIDRTRPRALPGTVRQIADALRAGSAVAAFPEGSTWCGRDRGSIRRAVFQAALDANVPVQPVQLRYAATSGGPSTATAFIGDDSLLGSLWRTAMARGVVAHVGVRPPLARTDHPDRRALAHAAQEVLAGLSPTAPAPGVAPPPAGHPVGLAGTVPLAARTAFPGPALRTSGPG